MQEIHLLLAEGHPDRAMKRFVELLKHEPKRTGELAKAMTQHLLKLYADYHVRPVHDFAELLEGSLPKPVAEAMMKVLGDRIGRTQHWEKELEALTRERLTREACAAVTTSKPKIALARLKALVGRATSEKDAKRLATSCVRAMGSMRFDSKRGAAIINELGKLPEVARLGLDLEATFDKTVKANQGLAFEESDRDSTQSLDDAIGQVRNACPHNAQVGEPSPEDIKAFTAEIAAIFRAGLMLRRADDSRTAHSSDDFIDALKIAVDFCPADSANVDSVSKAEKRIFVNLGGRAKLTAVRGLANLGENPQLQRPLIELAESSEGKDRVALIAGVMGGLRSQAFSPALKAMLKATKDWREQKVIIDAMGRIAGPEASDLILGLLEAAAKKSANPEFTRKAQFHLEALARIVRAKDTNPAERNDIVSRVIKSVKKGDARLALTAADVLFQVNLKQLDLELRNWAAQIITRAMFRRDAGDQINDTKKYPGGFREPLAGVLRRLGKDCLPVMLAEAERHASTFNGAVPVFAEVLGKIGDESALPVLETMIRTSLMHRESEGKDLLLDEKVLDVASGEMRDLDRDDIVHTLIHTVDELGGDRAAALIVGIANQVQSGQIASPGDRTISILAKFKLQGGNLDEVVGAVPERDIVTDKEFDKALGQAKGGLFKKNATQIQALAVLGRAARPEGVPSILRCLGDSESMVANAAETALAQFITPPPPKEQFEPFVMALLEDPKLLKGEPLERMLKVIEKSFPRSRPYDAIFNKHIAIEIEDGELAHRLKGAMAPMVNKADAPPEAESQGDEASGDGPRVTLAENKLNLMEAKRAYFKARKEWIANNKKGAEPKPPPGVG